MKKIIETLKKIVERSSNTEEAAKKISEEHKRLSKRTSKQIILDIEDYIKGDIDEKQLSLYLQSHGF